MGDRRMKLIFGLISGVLTALPIVIYFDTHVVVSFFLGMFATGFWLNVYSEWVGNPTLG